MLVLLIDRIYEYAAVINSCGIIYISSCMKIDAGVQALLRFSFENLRICNDGITEGRDLEITLFRLGRAP
jgi:hypothetical protein